MPNRAITRPLTALDTKYPLANVASSSPSASSGKSNVARIDGQATPSNPSGKPRLTKPSDASPSVNARSAVRALAKCMHDYC